MSWISSYLILNKKDYFGIAEEYIQLHQLFKIDTFYEKLNLFMKLIGNLVFSFLWKSHILSTCLTLYKTITEWKQFMRYTQIKQEIKEWKSLLTSIGGPYISTNDETYQSYVYADGMQRLHNQLFGLTEKGAKCLK
jgi:hypothetical protein